LKKNCEFIAQFNVSTHTARTTPTADWQEVYSIRLLSRNHFCSEKVNPFASFVDKNGRTRKENGRKSETGN